MAFVGMSLLSQSLLAAPPIPMTEAQLAAIQADAATRAPAAEAKAAEAQATLKTDLENSATATKAAAAFLVQNDLPAVKPDAPAAEGKPLDVKPGPDDTVVSCDGAIYFDPEERVLVYLKNVKVKTPDFNMTGRIDELKVFFAEKEIDEKDKEKAAKADDKKDKGGFGAGPGSKVGKAERVVATGAIVVEATPKEGEDALKASGAIFTYNVKTDEGTISGGWPWFTKGAMYMKSLKPDNLLRIHPKQNSMDTPGGGWEMAGPTEGLKDPKDPKEKKNH